VRVFKKDRESKLTPTRHRQIARFHSARRISPTASMTAGARHIGDLRRDSRLCERFGEFDRPDAVLKQVSMGRSANWRARQNTICKETQSLRRPALGPARKTSPRGQVFQPVDMCRKSVAFGMPMQQVRQDTGHHRIADDGEIFAA
jgi:hypothetical protein